MEGKYERLATLVVSLLLAVVAPLYLDQEGVGEVRLVVHGLVGGVVLLPHRSPTFLPRLGTTRRGLSARESGASWCQEPWTCSHDGCI